MSDRISLLTVGTEIIEGQIVDRNSAWISERLFADNLEVSQHLSVRDDRSQMLSALDYLFETAQTVILTGGLGPTTDDFTREIVAEHAQVKSLFSEANAERVAEKLRARGVTTVLDSQRRQSWFPEGAQILPNDSGTADGFALKTQRGNYLVLPGPPREIEAIWNAGGNEWLKSVAQVHTTRRRFTMTFIGIGESNLADKVEKYFVGCPVELGYRAHQPFVEVKFWYEEKDAYHLLARFERFREEMKIFWLWNNQNDVLGHINWNFKSPKQTLIIDQSSGASFSKRLDSAISQIPGSTVILGSAEVYAHEWPSRRIEFFERAPNEYSVQSYFESSKTDVRLEGEWRLEKSIFPMQRFSELFAVEKALQALYQAFNPSW